MSVLSKVLDWIASGRTGNADDKGDTMNSSEESAGVEKLLRLRGLEQRIVDLEQTSGTLRRDVTALERKVRRLEEPK